MSKEKEITIGRMVLDVFTVLAILGFLGLLRANFRFERKVLDQSQATSYIPYTTDGRFRSSPVKSQ